MGAIAREHSISIYFDEFDELSLSDSSIELDYLLRSVGAPFEQLSCEGWWLWQ